MLSLRTVLAGLAVVAPLVASVEALGINCRGSALCPRASWNNPSPQSVIQILHDAVWSSARGNDTVYNDHEHIVCVSQSQPLTITAGASYSGVSGSFTLNGNLHEGGICLFPQLPAGAPGLTLGQIRPLVSSILEHGCGTCGSTPIHFYDQKSNDPKEGILTFNYVSAPYCSNNCIADTAAGTPAANKPASINVTPTIPKAAPSKAAREVPFTA